MLRKMLIPALSVFAADLAAKLLAVQVLGDNMAALGGFLLLKKTENTGMALGIFSAIPWLGYVLPPMVILLGYVALFCSQTDLFTQACCGCILGGFLGNYGERLLTGHVTDMLYFPWLPWFVCNVADIAICFGSVLLAIHLIFGRERESAA